MQRIKYFKLIFPEIHNQALSKFDTYIWTQLVKPISWTTVQTVTKVEEILDMQKFILALEDYPMTTHYNRPHDTITNEVRRQLIFELLPFE